MIAALLPMLAPILGDVVRRVLPADPEAAAKAEAEVSRELLANAARLETAAADIVRTEAASSHWLAANWRPLVMLVFTGLIVARWFGWAAPNLSEAEYIALWNIVELGLGGYVIGRTVEKALPSLGDMMRRK